MKNSIHIFNPETDYALAAGRNTYNPPAAVLKFKTENSLLPVTFAEPGDVVIIPSENLDCYETEHLREASERKISVMTLSCLTSLCNPEELENKYEIRPWGWNHTLRNYLLRSGIPESMLKSIEEIDNLTQLSHRRSAIEFQKHLRQNNPDIKVFVAEEIKTVDDAIAFLNENGDAYFKAPWSSSGRGIAHADDFNREKLSQWLKGCISRQGSVIAERAFRRIADFASEWMYVSGEPVFLGLSYFNTTQSGRYAGNLLLPQPDIEEMISSHASSWSHSILEAQRNALAALISDKYSGPVGIDMLIDESGVINPCVEINFRQTMGMAAIYQYKIKASKMP